MTEEALDPNDIEADSARSSLVDAIAAAESGIPQAPRAVAPIAEAEQPTESEASTAEKDAEAARSALEAAVHAAEAAVADPPAAEVMVAETTSDAVWAEEPVASDLALAEEAEAGETSDEPQALELVDEPQASQLVDTMAEEAEALDAVSEVPAEVEAPAEPEATTSETEAASGIDEMIESLGEAPEELPETTEPAAAESTEALAPAEDGVAGAAEGADELVAVPVPLVAAMPAEEAAPKPPTVALWPFLVYLVGWLVFAGVYVWRFIELPPTEAAFDQPVYGAFIASAAVLVALGPIVAIATWITSWGKPDATKSDLLVSALIRGSIVTFSGVSIWWLSYILVDLLRLGRVL